MCEKNCGNCEFWGCEVSRVDERHFRDCHSCNANASVFGLLKTTCKFRCGFWQKREPTLREQLTERIENLVMHARGTGSIYQEIDEIIALSEAYRKEKNE